MREHLNGMYRCDVYFICKTMADVSASFSCCVCVHKLRALDIIADILTLRWNELDKSSTVSTVYLKASKLSIYED